MKGKSTSKSPTGDRFGLNDKSITQIFIIGLLMGTADGVPGVSGGTIALISGVYERLLAAITSVTPNRLKRLLGAVSPLNGGFSPNKACMILEEFDGWFLSILITGIGTAVVLVGQIIVYAKENSPIVLFGFFFGLIAASAIILLRQIMINTVSQALIGLTGAGFAFVLSGSSRVLNIDGLVIIFISGMVAVSAMILPGISGSLLLIILGQYTRMYAALDSFVQGIVEVVMFGTIHGIKRAGPVVLVFLSGGFVGLFTVGRLVQSLLDKNRNTTLIFLVSLVVGALRAPITEVSKIKGVHWTIGTIETFLLASGVGFVVVFLLSWRADDFNI